MQNFKEPLKLPRSSSIIRFTIWVMVFCLGAGSSYSQDPQRFADQVAAIKDRLVNKDKPLTVFTGSSSIRMWTDLQDRFPEHQLVNSGFGGSHFSDLNYYVEDLILGFNPTQVFIYEGDNDLAAGKSIAEVVSSATQLVETIHRSNRNCEIVLISPKPSLARWHLKEKYQALNEEFRQYAYNTQGVQFADVWTPMLEADGKVKAELFIDDGLHMNQKGYDIWHEVLKPYLR